MIAIIDRAQLAVRKAWSGQTEPARPVFIVGAQRSGTTILLDCLNRSMATRVVDEMENGRLKIRSDAEMLALLRSSRGVVVFKPLVESHRVRDLLRLAPNGRAIWMFRRASDRAHSAVARFGDHNLQVLRDLSRGEGMGRWQAKGLTPDVLEVVRAFDYRVMTPETAAALFWYLRNQLFFSQCLNQLDTVLPVSYESFVSAPGDIMRPICRFLRIQLDAGMTARVHSRSISHDKRIDDPSVEWLCETMYQRLREVEAQRFNELWSDWLT